MEYKNNKLQLEEWDSDIMTKNMDVVDFVNETIISRS